MIGNFSYEAQNTLIEAKEEMMKLNHPYIGTEHLMLSILNNQNFISKLLNNKKVTYEIFKEKLINLMGIGNKKNVFNIYTPLLKKVIENSILLSKDNEEKEISLENLFIALLELKEGIALRILVNLDIDLDELYKQFKMNEKNNKNNKKLILEELGTDLTKLAKKNELDPVYGREKECQRIIEILSRRTKNNPLLIGKAGVGKTAIVEELSRKIVKGEVCDKLLNKRIISLDMASVVAGTKYRGEFEERMKKIIKELENNNDIILFIDEIHTLVGAGGAEGAIDASNILKPALARGKIKCIGATTINEYKKSIYTDSALDRRFQKVTIEEISKEETKKILLKIKPLYEKYHNTIIDNDIIDLILELSDKYIYNRNRPDKEIDLLDEVCAKVNSKKISKININQLKEKINKITKEKNDYILNNEIKKALELRKKEVKLISKLNDISLKKENKKNKVTKEDIYSIINNKTNIPMYEINKDNLKTIKKLQENLYSNIIGQDKAIEELLNITKRIKLGFKENKCYSYMFIGPTGIGKTMLSKIYASSLVGENNIIKLDMSEYSDSTSVNKIIGASPGYIGYSDNKNILEEIKDKPNAVIILDEIDKAHPKVIDLLYQILEDNQLKTSSGELVKFNNNIIIMTSNIGFERKGLGFNNNVNNNVLNELSNEFNKAFINRIDNIIIFNQLNKKDIYKIIKIKLNKIKNKFKNLNITFKEKLIEEIINEINYQEYGARKIDKVIYSYIENIIIDKILLNENNIVIDKLKTIKIN